MRYFHRTSPALGMLSLATAVSIMSLFSYRDNNRVSATNLEGRQVSGVVGTSQFLRRAYQASTVVDNFIYVDGGEFSFLNNGTPNYEYSNTILSIDLSQSWTNSTVKILSTAKPADCASLNGPSLWYNPQEGALYSGFAGWASNFLTEDSSLNNISIWTFTPDGTGSGAWKDVIPSGSSALASLNRPSQAFQAFGDNSAWVLGGFDSYDPGQYPYLPSMVHFNMSSRTFANISTPANLANGGAVTNGAMHYVPSFGPQGLFVAMGGDIIQNVPGLISFDTVAVFDPAKREWFNQTTTGSPPTSRLEFCTAGINSTNGTYEIFVYAGWGTALGAASVQFDTINILTLPAFHWISVPNDPKNPRIGLTCNAVGGSQILTIGGRDGNPNQTYGTHASIIASTYDSPDPNAQGLAIFDMTALTWMTQYTAGAPGYEQSSPIKQFYAVAQQTYSQNLTAGLAALLQVTHFANTTNTSATGSVAPSPGSSHTATGGIAGGTVGGVVGLTVVVGCITLLIRRRKRRPGQEFGSANLPNEIYPMEGKEQQASLQEMDQSFARPAELSEAGMFEMESRQVSVSGLGDGRRD